MIGEILSHYRIVEKIGEGGMGEVYRAVDTKLNRQVALKMLPSSLVADPNRMQDFSREAQVIASLNHPNIVIIYSIEEVKGRHFIVLELIQGKTLAELIPANGLQLEQFLEIAIPLADAVSAAHEKGVTHRDLKPANVMMGKDGRIKVLDFGLARVQEKKEVKDWTESLTQTQTDERRITGTIPYMSPEQLQSLPPDHRSDLFSLGILLYQMAIGSRPFQGTSFNELIASILRDTPPPITDARPDLPHQLALIIAHCLEKDVRRRWQSCLDLRNELDTLKQDLSGATGRPPASIAVLPFLDLSQAKDQDYFCEGIAEEIIHTLSRIQDLHVVSRTSAFQFKNVIIDSREIGRRLGVRTLLEGSVRKMADRLRIGVELINASDGYNLWSERYDREIEDIFSVQEEIARNIAQILRIKLTPQEHYEIARTPTSDLEAYEYYMRGRQFFYLYTKKSMEFALKLFSQAIDRDPEYARAYAGIADCCSFLYMYGGSAEKNREAADTASRKALELDPGSAEAHASRAVALTSNNRLEEADREFEAAISLNPGLFEAYYFYARTAFVQGNLEKAAQLFEKANLARPEDYQSLLLVAQIYSSLGRDEATADVRRRGVKLVEERLKLNPDDSRALYMGANGLVALGDKQRGLDWAEQALEIDPEEPMVLYNVACIQSLAGQTNDAITSLEKAVDGGLHQKGWLENDSNLDLLRDHPRFQALMRGM